MFHMHMVTQVIHELSQKLTKSDFDRVPGNKRRWVRWAAANSRVLFLGGSWTLLNINWETVGGKMLVSSVSVVSCPEGKLSSRIINKKLRESCSWKRDTCVEQQAFLPWQWKALWEMPGAVGFSLLHQGPPLITTESAPSFFFYCGRNPIT